MESIMLSKSTSAQYGRTAQRYHWISALLIIAMIPLGFIMQNVENESVRLILYRSHVVIGAVILLMTIARIVWRRKDINPEPPEGLDGLHLKVFNAVHVLLYALIFVLTLSGIGTIALGGMGDFLSGVPSSQLPTDVSELGPRRAHGITARIYIALLVGHIGGVVFHQVTKSDVFGRMGINWFKAKQNA